MRFEVVLENFTDFEDMRLLSLSLFSLTVLDPTNSFASACCSKQWLWCFIYKGRLPVNSPSSLTSLHFGGSADCWGRFGRQVCHIFSPAPQKKTQKNNMKLEIIPKTNGCDIFRVVYWLNGATLVSFTEATRACRLSRGKTELQIGNNRRERGSAGD